MPVASTTALTPSSNWKVTAQFLGLAIIWGASFLFIAVGLQGLSPAQVVLGRLVCGAVALGIICLVTRQKLPRSLPIWIHLCVVAVFLCVVPFLLFSWAEQHISSGLASIYNATTPLMTALVAALALRQERLNKLRAAGLVVGFLGVVVVFGPWQGSANGSLIAQIACLGATLCYGIGFVYMRKFISPLGLPSVAVATMQVGIGAVIMLILAPFIAFQPVHLTAPVVTSVLLLGVVGTGLAYVWNTNVVKSWGATNASTVTYLTPLVGVTLGALILAEPVHWNEPVGALVVVVGIALGQGRLSALLGRK